MMTFRTVSAPIALAGILVLAGCGSSSESATTGSGSGSGAGGGDVRAALSDYVACLAENGVSVTLPSGGPGGERPGGAPPGMPEGGTPSGAPGDDIPPSGAPGSAPGDGGGGFLTKPEGVSQQAWDTAREACANKLPQGPGGQPGADGSAPAPRPSASAST